MFIPILSHSTEIVNLKNKLEEKISCKLTISSADRTSEHNKRVGGAKNSYHLQNGMALDLQKDKDCKLSYYEIGLAAKDFFNGVIYYSKHIHVDLRKDKLFKKGSY